MSEFIIFSTRAALVIMVLLLVPCVWVVARGRTEADRLQAIETTNTLLIGVVLLLAIYQESPLSEDIALVLAAFGFIATIAIARYIREGRVF